MATSSALNTDDPIFSRLEEQIVWYDRKSSSAQKAYKRMKVVEIFAAAVIPFLAGLRMPQLAWVTGGLGVLITILEGVLHLNQYQEHWTNYRATCESLRHEKFTCIAGAAPYGGAANPRTMLAERVEALVSRENAQWSLLQHQTASANSPEASQTA